MLASPFSKGFQRSQRWRSSICANTTSGGAAMAAVRSMRKAAGRVAITTSSTAIRASTPTPILTSMEPSLAKGAGPPERPGGCRWLLRDRGGVRGGEVGDAVRSVEHLADLALAVAGDLQEAPGQLDRMLLRIRLQQREPGYELLGLGKGAVGDGQAAAGAPHPRAQRARQAPLGREQHARALHLLDEPVHRGHLLRGRGDAGLGGLVDRQESHLRFSVWLWLVKTGAFRCSPVREAVGEGARRRTAAHPRSAGRRLRAGGHLGAEALLLL